MAANSGRRELRVLFTRKDMWWTDSDGYFRLPTNKPVSEKELDFAEDYNERLYHYKLRRFNYSQLSEEDKKIISFKECIIVKAGEVLEDEKEEEEEEALKAPVFTLKIVNGEPKVVRTEI